MPSSERPRAAMGRADPARGQHGDRHLDRRTTSLAGGAARRTTQHAGRPDGTVPSMDSSAGSVTTITVLVDDELSFEPGQRGPLLPHRRRPFDLMHQPQAGHPADVSSSRRCCCGPPTSAAPRAAHGVIAAAVQQRLTTPERDWCTWVDQLQRPLRRAKPFKRTLGDIAGGAQSGSELDVRRMCRRFAIRLPDRQIPRVDRGGQRRWTDCEWELGEWHQRWCWRSTAPSTPKSRSTGRTSNALGESRRRLGSLSDAPPTSSGTNRRRWRSTCIASVNPVVCREDRRIGGREAHEAAGRS